MAHLETKVFSPQLQVQFLDPINQDSWRFDEIFPKIKIHGATPLNYEAEIFEKRKPSHDTIRNNYRIDSAGIRPKKFQSEERNAVQGNIRGPETAVTAQRIVDFDTLNFCYSILKKRRSLIARVCSQTSWDTYYCTLTGDHLAVYKEKDEYFHGIDLVDSIDITKFTFESGHLKQTGSLTKWFKRSRHHYSTDMSKVRGVDEDETAFSLVPVVRKGWLAPIIRACKSHHFAVQSSHWSQWELQITQAQNIARAIETNNGRYDQGDIVVERKPAQNPLRPLPQ